MMTADDLSELRNAGKSDTDILRDYREFDPQHNQDIDDLLKGGKSPKQVLEDLAAYNAGAGGEPPKDKMASKGVLEKTRGALQYGASNMLAGLSSTARKGGFSGTADVLQSGSKSVAPVDYEAAGSKFDITSPSTYGYAPRALAEGIPGVASDLLAGAAGSVAGPGGSVAGFMASNAARNFGPNVDARMENQAPGVTPSTSDYLAAGGATVGEAALSRLGVNSAISSSAKGAGMKAAAQVPGLIAKATGADAAAGAAGNVVNQVGRTAGTDKGLDINPTEVGNSAALSGATAGAIRAARGVGDVTNAVRFKDVDEAAGARVVERLDRTKADTSTPENSYKSVELARKSLDTEINDAHQVVKPLLKTRGNDTDTDTTRVLVKDTLTLLKAGGDAPEGSISGIRDAIGDTSEGMRLVNLLEDRQALNTLMSKGRFEKSADQPNGYFAGGMAANRQVDSVLNPLANLKAKIAGGATVAGIAELPMFAQMGINGALLAKIAAAQAAAYGGVRAIDKATGLRNPAAEFMTRFRGEGGNEDLALPSFRQEAEDAKAAKALDKAQGKTPDPVKLAKARAKEQDRAWKAKEQADKQAQAAEDRKQAEVDKAFNSKEDPQGLKDAQEDALWRQKEAADAKAQADDYEASAGIQAGYSALLKDAVTKGAAAKKLKDAEAATKASETDKAFKAKKAQEAEEAKRQSEVDKAWEKAEGRPGPSEDDLWAAHAKQEAATPSDLEAEAGIQAGYKELAARAKKASDLRQSQTDKAYKAKTAQEAEETKAKALRNSGFSKAEAERSRPDPDRVKAAQEDAMWRQQEEPGGPQDWSDMDAMAAIKREVDSRDRSSAQLTKTSALLAKVKKAQEAKAAKPTKETKVDDVADTLDFPGDTPLKIKVKPKPKDDASSAKAEPRNGSTDDTPNPDVYTVRVGDQVVERPKENVRNPQAYIAKTRKSMKDRQAFVDELSSAGIKTNGLLSKLNNSFKEFEPAYKEIIDIFDDLPFEKQGAAYKALETHIGNIEAGYGR